jgi:predicted permease
MSFWGQFFRRQRMMEELDQDIRDFVERETEDNIERGMSPEEARYAALRKFGNVTRAKEETWEVWSFVWLEQLWQDVRFGLRQLLRSPGFTVVVALSLALGIGANTAIFSLMDAVMLKALPVRDPGQLVFLSRTGGSPALTSDNGSENEAPFSYPSFEAFRAGSQAFSSLFGFVSFREANVTADGQANLAEGELVTGDYFTGLGIAPVLGRAITAEDQKPNAPRVAVISYNYWLRQFGRNAAVLGKGILVNGAPFAIVGVTPPEFFGVQPGRAVDIWVPLVGDSKLLPYGMSSSPGGRSLLTARDWWWLIIMGRLRPGAAKPQATAQLEVLFQQNIAGLRASSKGGNEPHVRLEPASKGLSILQQQFSRPLWVLMIIVGVVLLIACANVAGLLVARGAVRQKEVVVRLSLGAPRLRLVRQLLTESVLLAGFGGLLGLAFAFWANRVLLYLMASGGELLAVNVEPDARVLAFTAAVSVVTGILFGLAPALRCTRVELAPALNARAGSTRGAAPRTRLGLGKSLVVAQVALSLPLLIGAGLFVRTLQNLENQDLGFRQDHLLLFAVDPAKNGYEGDRLNDFCERLLARLQTVPGVRSATMSEVNLISGTQDHMPISIQGYNPKPGQNMGVDWNNVGPAFFETFGISLLLGRGVEWRDTSTAPRVAVVNQAFSRDFLDGRNPVGYHLQVRVLWVGKSGTQSYEVIGMVQDAKYASLRRAPRPTVYAPFNQAPWTPWDFHYEVRTAGNPLGIVPEVRQAVREIDPNVPLDEIKTQTEQIAETLVEERLFAHLSALFSGLALLLAAIGVYGLLAYSVSRRTSEMGIRVALGAHRADILGLVMRQTLFMVGLGVAIGIPAALAATRLIRSLLYGLRPNDPLTIAAAGLGMIMVALLAGYFPARRATKVDPMVALRYE